MTCEHIYVRDGWTRGGVWNLPVRAWRCVRCRLRTRTYDSVDAQGQRPVHKHMSVAVPGFNTVRRAPLPSVIESGSTPTRGLDGE
jgi:hypothetical protein